MTASPFSVQRLRGNHILRHYPLAEGQEDGALWELEDSERDRRMARYLTTPVPAYLLDAMKLAMAAPRNQTWLSADQPTRR